MNLNDLANRHEKTSELVSRLTDEINKTLMREYDRQKDLHFIPFMIAADMALTGQRTIGRAYIENDKDMPPEVLAKLKEGWTELEHDMERVINETD